jgi:hypothetical protein
MRFFTVVLIIALLFWIFGSCKSSTQTSVPGKPTKKEQKAMVEYNKTHKNSKGIK